MSLDMTKHHPLLWPQDRPRTPAVARKSALFRHEGRPITVDRAFRRVRDQLAAMTRQGQNWRTTNVLLSSNVRFTKSGARDQNVSRADPADVGVALYFDLDRRPHVLACDRWDTVADNAAAIAAHIEALRGQERWGVGDLAQAFAGHAALPAPDPWWTVLGVERGATLDQIATAYRTLARKHHPDTVGGHRAAWDRLTAANEAAKLEKGA